MINFAELNNQIKKNIKKQDFSFEVKKLLCKYFSISLKDIEEEKGFIKLNKHFERFPVYLAVKKSEKFNLQTVFNNPEKNVLLRWWIGFADKLENERERLKLVLVFTKDYFPILCLMLMKTFKEILLSVKTRKCIKTIITFESEIADEIFIICKFEDLLKEKALELSLL
ncbi:MAG: hypothetical protein DRP34_00060 [Thermodesulfobacteriota bacterium]|nr:MAG: hypothetical protein DRP34_00060 [Thermodesulfobacteriota bacterium]